MVTNKNQNKIILNVRLIIGLKIQLHLINISGSERKDSVK